MQLTYEEMLYFGSNEKSLKLYKKIRETIIRIGYSRIVVTKSQIAFKKKKGFVFLDARTVSYEKGCSARTNYSFEQKK
jgi:hypothetical protein